MNPGPCGKCGGHLTAGSDRHGHYLLCVNCGTLADALATREPPSGEIQRDYEITRYLDNGCEVWQTCLECPLPECRLDNPGLGRRFLTLWQERDVVETILREKLGNAQAARRFGTRRTHIEHLMRCHQELRGVWEKLMDSGQ